MSLKEVAGQERVIRLLKNALKNQRVAHAYCFCGPEGTGKEKTAIEWAKALNCEQPGDDACDRCRSCRQISHGNHPDVIFPERDGQTIGIGQIRELQRRFSYSPPAGTTRVLILRHAETLTLQAANSLLKFLEEPASLWVAILLTENVHNLPPTVLSRCQLIRFQPLHPRRIEAALIEESVNPGAARVAAHLSSSVSEARRLVERDEFAPFCERVIEWIGDIVSGKLDPFVEVQTEWLARDTDREDIQLLLGLALLWLRDLQHRQLGMEEPPVFSENDDSLRRQASKWTHSGLLNAMDAVIQAQKALTGPVQPQAVLEQMVLAMQGGFDHGVSRGRPFQTSG
ncbi:MAG: DNA polymerase III subunit delta' [Firmicutes bacterium]|nr:DNA polymerase III subunit delta' [Bacillota bacterium]